MANSLLTQGVTKIRDLLKAGITYIGISTDSTAFSAAHTGINNAAGATWTDVGVSTQSNFSSAAFDSSRTIDGTSIFTGQTINSLCLASNVGIRSATGSGGTHTGGSIVGTDTVVRLVRAAGIPVETGASITFGIRVTAADGG